MIFFTASYIWRNDAVSQILFVIYAAGFSGPLLVPVYSYFFGFGGAVVVSRGRKYCRKGGE